MGPVLSLAQIEALGMVGTVALATITSWLALRQWTRVNKLEEIVGYLLQEREPTALAPDSTAIDNDWTNAAGPVYEPLASQLGSPTAATPLLSSFTESVDQSTGSFHRVLSVFNLDAAACPPSTGRTERQEVSLRRWMSNIKARGADA